MISRTQQCKQDLSLRKVEKYKMKKVFFPVISLVAILWKSDKRYTDYRHTLLVIFSTAHSTDITNRYKLKYSIHINKEKRKIKPISCFFPFVYWICVKVVVKNVVNFHFH